MIGKVVSQLIADHPGFDMSHKRKRSFAAVVLLGKQGARAFTRLYAPLSSSIEIQKLVDNTGTVLNTTRARLSEIPGTCIIPEKPSLLELSKRI